MFISILQEPKGGLSKQKTKTTYKQPNKKTTKQNKNQIKNNNSKKTLKDTHTFVRKEIRHSSPCVQVLCLSLRTAMGSLSLAVRFFSPKTETKIRRLNDS